MSANHPSIYHTVLRNIRRGLRSFAMTFPLTVRAVPILITVSAVGVAIHIGQPEDAPAPQTGAVLSAPPHKE